MTDTKDTTQHLRQFIVAVDTLCGEANEAAGLAVDLFSGQRLEDVRRGLARCMEIVDADVRPHLRAKYPDVTDSTAGGHDAVVTPPSEPTQGSEASWLQSLSAVHRALFLTRLSHNLTIASRMLALSTEPAEVRLEHLRELNEIQHRVVNYASYALGSHEDQRFLAPLVKAVILGPRDPTLRHETVRAWVDTRSRFDSFT